MICLCERCYDAKAVQRGIAAREQYLSRVRELDRYLRGSISEDDRSIANWFRHILVRGVHAETT